MNTIYKIVRIALTGVLLELTIIGCNSLVDKFVYGGGGDKFNPCEAIYSSIVYLAGVCHWRLSMSYISVMLATASLVMLYYSASKWLVPHRTIAK
jgi:hypothetical protein